MLNRRSSGIIMPIFSLPGNEIIGTLGDQAYQFVDFLVETNQHYWQILPMGVTSYGDSPYQSFSSYAGNPYFIDLYRLICKGWLDQKDMTIMQRSTHIDYEKLWQEKYPLLRKAFENSHFSEIQVEEVLEKYWWLDDFSTFMALKSYFQFRSRVDWEEANTKRSLTKELSDKIQDEKRFHIFMQAEFFEQWFALKEYADFKGIEFIGDIPMFVAEDSCDVWANPEYFQLDESGKSTSVAGVPPDYFSKSGQLWGNPLYDWEMIKNDGFKWWLDRINESLKMYHVLRIDHFRGFESYWSVDKNQKTAEKGHWVPALGKELFTVFKQQCPQAQVIVEDLGVINKNVEDLIAFTGFPNMKVLLFAFDGEDVSPHSPDYVSENCVYYTATHDNDTVEGWAKKKENYDFLEKAKKYFMIHDISKQSISFAFIENVWKSRANIAMTTMQDLMGLDNTARINTPSLLGENWKWRLEFLPNSQIRKWLSQLTKDSNRIIH
ncbi:MAG: 4-alpha-glucanotransferase [Brevinema sp.]